MDSLLEFIKTSRELLKKSLELCDSLESSCLSNDFNNEMKEKKLNKMSKKCSKLRSCIVNAKKIQIKRKIISEAKKQNGDHLKESSNADKKISRIIIEETEEKIINENNEMDVDELNNAAKEEILNGSDSEGSVISEKSLIISSDKCILKSKSDNLFDIVNKEIIKIDSPTQSFDDGDQKLAFDNKFVDQQVEKKEDNCVESCSELKNSLNVSNEEVESNNMDISEDNKINEIALNDSTIEISDEETYTIKECSVVLEDIAKSEDKELFYKDYINNIEMEVNKLSQIPKFTNKKSKKDDTVDEKRSGSHNIVSKSSTIFQSDSEENDNGSDNNSDKAKSEDIDISNTIMVDSPLSSTDSKTSSKSSKKDYKPNKNKKSLRQQNMFQRRITRSLKIPIMSDSETSQKTSLSNDKSKKSKKGSKHSKAIVCLSSTSDEESDASASDLRNNKRKKSSSSKRKNKKQKLDSDDEKNSDDINTRKNIHKIIKKSKLSEATKAAEIFEMERRKRMEEKQEIYNKSLLNNDLSSDNSKSALILEKDQNGETIVAVHKHISDQLKLHQIEAINFMYDCVIESVACLLKSQENNSDKDKPSSAVGGCILAHCMGLGKTLSLIAFMHTMLTTPILNLYSCIVVCPANTALNWKNEWKMWMPSDSPIKIFEVCTAENRRDKISIVQDWQKKGGILIIGYDMFRVLASGNSKTLRSKALRQKMQHALVNPGPDFIVCDEGHLLKNEKSAINKVINTVKTKRRIVLTGTPLQNKLPEYHTMANFVKPSLLGTHKEFLNRFVNPIYNGQHINSTPYDVKIMKKRSHILFKTLDGCVHRRDYSALVKYLPPKYEYVIKIRLTDIQMKLYRAYLAIAQMNKFGLFTDQRSLARIMTHPFVLCMHQEIQDKKMFMIDSDGESFLDDESEEDSEEDSKIDVKKKPLEENNVITIISDDDDQNNDGDDDIKHKEKTDEIGANSENSADEVVKTWSSSTRRTRQNKLNDSDEEPKINFELENLKDTTSEVKHWWSDIIQPEQEHQIEISSKLTILFQILRKASDIGDKVILFSQSLLVLDIIQKYLHELHILAENVNEDLQKLNEPVSAPPDAPEISEAHKVVDFFSEIGYNTWEKGLDYDRMDGSTHLTTRADIMTRFNAETDRRLRLFLISTKAGGMGVNLVAANRVVIFDVSWNPSHDIQAIFRSYRFGQNKPVYVYRLVSQATIEEKMYERQVTKQSLSLRVVDEQQISRYFTEEDLKSLYKFEPDIYDPNKEKETPILPKDRFLAELIQDFPQWIYSYHEHDSLLQNKDEEELTEAERQDAWKEFEDEKIHGSRLINQPMQVGIDPALFAQAQMNLMMQQHPQYAALFGQNYMNLLRYVLGQQPELKYHPAQLSTRMQGIFFLSLQKYKDANPTAVIGSAPVASTAESTSGPTDTASV